MWLFYFLIFRQALLIKIQMKCPYTDSLGMGSSFPRSTVLWEGCLRGEGAYMLGASSLCPGNALCTGHGGEHCLCESPCSKQACETRPLASGCWVSERDRKGGMLSTMTHLSACRPISPPAPAAVWKGKLRGLSTPHPLSLP